MCTSDGYLHSLCLVHGLKNKKKIYEGSSFSYNLTVLNTRSSRQPRSKNVIRKAD